MACQLCATWSQLFLFECMLKCITSAQYTVDQEKEDEGQMKKLDLNDTILEM